MDSILKTAVFSVTFNTAVGTYHIVSGAVTHSWWLFTIGFYYAVLSIVRFVVLLTKKRPRFVARFTGMMLMVMTLPLVGTVILAALENRGTKWHEIIMIIMAIYAFTKITFATIHLIKSRKSTVVKHVALRNLSFADAFVSIFALQRSMLASFGNMSEDTILLFNVLLGAAVCIVVFLLGFYLVRNKKYRSSH